MKFDISKVYTSANAKELRKRDKVFVSDSMEDLKKKVKSGKKIVELEEVKGEDWLCRFKVKRATYSLAYLVERAENCTNCENYLKDECGIKEGDNPIRCWNYHPKTEGCGEVCSDDRFEIIAKARAYIIEATNIKTSADEMKVLDNFLFRLWQLGWLDRFKPKTDERIKSLQEWAIKQASKYDRKYAKYNDARAWVMAQRYYLVVELCDKALGRAEI